MMWLDGLLGFFVALGRFFGRGGGKGGPGLTPDGTMGGPGLTPDG